MESTQKLTGKDFTETIRRPVSHYIIEPKGASIDEAKRVIAMVFTYNKETGDVYYGSSIFRRVLEHEVCTKQKNRQTAERRFRMEPVNINMEPNENMTVVEVANKIRFEMRKLGVSGTRTKSETPKKNIVADETVKEIITDASTR